MPEWDSNPFPVYLNAFIKTLRHISPTPAIYQYNALEQHKQRVTRWLRHCATSRKVAGLIPDAVVRIFH